MKISNFHKIMVLLLMLMVSGVGCAQTEIDGIWYNLDYTYGGEEPEAEVTSGDGRYYSGDIVIPSTVTYGGKEYKVTCIQGCAFSDCDNLNSVVISDNVKRIGQSAFSGCSNLSSVIISEAVTNIDYYTFQGCSNPKIRR